MSMDIAIGVDSWICIGICTVNRCIPSFEKMAGAVCVSLLLLYAVLVRGETKKWDEIGSGIGM